MFDPNVTARTLTPATGSSSLYASRHVLVGVLVVSLVGLVTVMDYRRREAVNQLGQLAAQVETLTTNEPQNSQVAKEVIQKVGQLFQLPEGSEPTVATVVDVEALRKQNPVFYANAKNGDYLVVTTSRAILYDPTVNIILDVVPVQIQPADQPVATEPSPRQ